MTKSSEDILVSVLMTSYNREKFIGPAIESVLSSTHLRLELIVCDDHSSDKTVEIARTIAKRDPRVKVFEHDFNLGDYPNRNRAASYATGDYLIYADSDDIMYPHAITVFLWCFRCVPDAALAFEDIHDNSGAFPMRLSPVESYQRHFFGRHLFSRAPGSVMIRRSVFVESGMFSSKRYVGDFEYWLRVCAFHTIVLAPGMLHWVRKHDAQELNYDALEYAKLRTDVALLSFNESNCPLSRKEVELATIIMRRSLARILFRYVLRIRISPLDVFKVCSRFNISLFDFFAAILPSRFKNKNKRG